MRAFAAAILACVASIALAQDVAVPALTGRVIDQTGTLSEAQRAALDEKLAAFERKRGSQVAVLVVPTTAGEAIEDFATRVTDSWKLGRKGVDDGVLFVVAKNDRKLRIHTGRGVQGTLTDALSKRIVSDIVAPRFREGDFARGIDEGVEAILKAIEGEELPLPKAKSGHGAHTGTSPADFLILAFFLVPFVAMIVRGIFGRLFGAGITSGITGVAAWFLVGSLAVGIVAAIVAFLITLFMGSGVSRGARSGGWIPVGGGWSGGGGGGGFGGGGFSGGGGGFDGGGASGSW